MTSAAYQEALVALATNPALRESFPQNLDALGESFGLSGADRAALTSIPPENLARYANGLVSKRWRGMQRVTPLTCSVTSSFEARARTWLAHHPLPWSDSVLPPGLRNAFDALVPLRTQLAHDADEPPWAPELLSYEVLGGCTQIDGLTREFRARFRIDDVVERLRGGASPLSVPPRSCSIRFDGGGRVAVSELS